MEKKQKEHENALTEADKANIAKMEKVKTAHSKELAELTAEYNKLSDEKKTVQREKKDVETELGNKNTAYDELSTKFSILGAEKIDLEEKHATLE